MRNLANSAATRPLAAPISAGTPCWLARGVRRGAGELRVVDHLPARAHIVDGVTTVWAATGGEHPLITNASASFLRALEARSLLRWTEPTPKNVAS